MRASLGWRGCSLAIEEADASLSVTARRVYPVSLAASAGGMVLW